ncbi:MAG TPA: alpha-2-macroglobulin family protein [Thermoanaerobaculia bacterium]|nr:alpha-2-macroglobulin family protein [Thermoanaerobaculia bacterium]
MKRIAVALALLLLSTSIHAANGLRIVSAGPVGEVASLAEANEVRVVFSEPMVVLGKIPTPVTAPFFRIEPAVRGTFRWSGTTTLIFTPHRLPYATEYTVTIDKSAKSVAGKTLDEPYRWTFSTPSVRLLRTDWYRKGGRATGALVIALRFNQPVDAQQLLPRLQLRTFAHNYREPSIPDAGRARLQRLEPNALVAFDAKKKKAESAAQADGALVLSFLATEWNKERFPPSPDLVVLETKPGIPQDTWILVTPPSGPTYTIEADSTFFIGEIGCVGACDPEWRNGIGFGSTPVAFENVRKAVTVTDITDPKKEVVIKPKKVDETYDYPSTNYSLDELGYALLPAHKYAVRIDPSLTGEDGQKLGYTWMAVIENWHKSAFVSFGSGHGVWESSGGPVLPFAVRNYKSVKQWLAPLSLDRLMPVMQELRETRFQLAPKNAKEQTRTLNLPADKIAAVGLDLTPAIGADQMGIAWAAVRPGEAIAKARTYDPSITATLVQATNLGISVKDSPQNTVVMVTRLDDGKPVAGASVSIRDRNNKVFWTGTTDANGLAIAPNTDLRRDKTKKDLDEWEMRWRALSDLHFVVIAEKDGDAAYVGSDWNEGITPWEFDTRYDVMEADPLLRGTVFTDRGVYKLGEEVHFKAVVRADTPDGMKLLAPGTKLEVRVTDSHNQEVDKRTIDIGPWSSAEWTLKLPQEAPLGQYAIMARSKDRGSIFGNFLVAAYRRPDFRVDNTLDAKSSLAGTKLNGTIAGRYLFGAPMSDKQVNWTYSKAQVFDVPSKIRDLFPPEQYAFLGWDWELDVHETGSVTISQGEDTLDEKGGLKLALDTDEAAGWPFSYTLEGVVTDVTRQQIAGRASFRVDPAPWYIGVRTPPYFAEAKDGIDTEIVAVGLDGLADAGVKVTVELKRIQWVSVRRAEGHGFYEWETERKEIPAGEWTITSETKPVPLHIPLKEGGRYVIIGHAENAGRSTTTRVGFYALGEGYTAWERFDHNRIDLVPEKTTYRPGETARIMIKSPWETATALLTTEREGVRTWTTFTLTSTQQTVSVPLTERDIPNVFVSVLLVKGRTKKDPDINDGKDGSDPGKPAFRLGYVELQVEDASKRLAVNVKADRDEFRPASKAKIEVNVRDAGGKPSQSEVTLWAVDYGVLSLTNYRTPDVLESIYLDKALQVANEDSRQRIVSRRVLTPKGGGEGGGGGRDAGPGVVRKDFRVLAFWLGSLITDAKGRARTEVTLPESLTTYRIMAVAGDRESRFGWASNEIRVNKPLMLTPAWPRFLTAGDKAHFGAVVHNQLKKGGKATVTIESLDPNVIAIGGSSTVDVKPGSANEVRFDAEAKSVGVARIRMRVKMGREADAFEDVIPVRVIVSPETVAAYGEVPEGGRPVRLADGTSALQIPTDVVPGFGGLRVDLSSTAMVGLAEGAQYLVEYPYGCAEQRSSRALALMLVTDLGDAFSLPGIDPAKQKEAVQTNLDELRKFQCGDGGFSFWPGECWGPSPPYLTSYVMHVFQRGAKLGYRVDQTMMDRAYAFLEGVLGQAPPNNEGWRPAYNAWQAFALKVLAEGGRNVDSNLNRIYEYRDRMPVFGLTHLLDAMIAKKETSGPRVTDLKRRIMNSILPEGGHAFVNELSDPYLLWFWNSNVRSTAMTLGTLVRHGSEEEMVKRMVRWMMRVRKEGRWGNTQENAWAMEALVDYYRKYESEIPDFVATVALGTETIATETFKGRSTEARRKEFSMQDVLRRSGTLPVVFTREGTGTLFYMLRLRYARNIQCLQALDSGFRVERSYALQSGGEPSTTFKAGDLILVTLRIRNTKERRYVAVTDPIPAGTEPVETWFATTAAQLAETQMRSDGGGDWWTWWERGGFDHVERHDDRVNLFATRLGEGEHEYSYLVRATTAGTFITAPTHAEEMYEPEVFGRTGTVTVEVQK